MTVLSSIFISCICIHICVIFDKINLLRTNDRHYNRPKHHRPLSLADGVLVHVSKQIKHRIDRYAISSKDFGRHFVNVSAIIVKSGTGKHVEGTSQKREPIITLLNIIHQITCVDRKDTRRLSDFKY